MLKRIFSGIANGFPLLQSINKSIKGNENKDYLSLSFEFITVIIILSVVFKVITIQDAEKLIELIKK